MRQYLLLVLAGVMAGCAMGPGPSPTGMTKLPSGKEVRIGVILPLSGAFAIYGKSSLHGIECAAGLRSPCAADKNFTLVTKDSLGDPKVAAQAVRDLVTNDQVVAIVGPLLSKTVPAAAAEAEQLGVPLMSLSQLDGIAEIGDYVYRIGMNARSQVNALTHYAVNERKMTRLAILYPNNKYGKLYRSLFRSTATALGAEIVVDRAYDGDLARILQAHIKAKNEPLKERMQPKINTRGEIVVDLASKPLPKMSAVQGVDAIFIPDSHHTLVGMVAVYGKKIFGGATLLGVNRWNNTGILAAGSAVHGAIFVDGFFSSSANIETQRFVSAFTQAYGIEPTLLEAQAYDAMRLFDVASQRGTDDPKQMQQRLKKVKKFHGVTGLMLFNDVGDVEKELFLLTVEGGRIHEIGQRKSSLESWRRLNKSSRATREAVIHPKYRFGGEAPDKGDPLSEEKYGNF